MKFSIKNLLSKCDQNTKIEVFYYDLLSFLLRLSNPQIPADLVTFTEEILNGKLHFLCSENINEAYETLPYLGMIRNIRRQRDDQPNIPQRKEDIPVLPRNYQVTNRRDRFLWCNSSTGDTIIFGTNDAIWLLGTNPH